MAVNCETPSRLLFPKAFLNWRNAVQNLNTVSWSMCIKSPLWVLPFLDICVQRPIKAAVPHIELHYESQSHSWAVRRNYALKQKEYSFLGDMGFRREWKEYKPDSGLNSISLIKCEWVSESHSVVSDSLRPHGLYSPWNSLGQNAGVGSLSLLQGIFPTQGSNPGLPHCRWILHQLSHKAGTNHSTGVSLNFQICKMRRWVRWSLRFLLVLSYYESGAQWLLDR